MNKFLSFFISCMACLSVMNASAYSVSLKVDHPEHIDATISGESITFDSSGNAQVEYTGYETIMLSCQPPYVLSSMRLQAPGHEWDNGYLGNAYQHTLYVGDYNDGNKYEFTIGNLNELRTASVTLKIDDPTAVQLKLSWTEDVITPTDNETIVKYIPDKETPFNLYTTSGKNLYSLTVGSETLTGSNGSYYISDVKDGDIIDAKAIYPEIYYSLKFNLPQDCQDGFITSVTSDGSPLSSWQNTQVKIGSVIEVRFNTTDYNVTKFDKNGETINPYGGGFYSPYNFIMEEDTQFDIEAAPYGMVEMTVKVPKADYVKLYRGYNSEDLDARIALQDGETRIKVSTTQSTIHLKGTSLANITKVSQDGKTLSADYSQVYDIEVKEGSVIEVLAEEIIRDKSFIFYFDSPAKATDQYKGFYGYRLAANGTSRNIDLVEGYNEINYSDVDGEFMFTVYNGNTSNVFLYVNGEAPQFTSNDITYYFTPEDGDVMKCYVGEKPSEYQLTFTVEEGLNPEVVVDKITPLPTLGDTKVLQGTSVCITPGTNDNIRWVKCNDTEIASTDGKYEFTVTCDTKVSINVEKTSKIQDVSTETETPVIYNLQGIPVNPNTLTPGIYIINGKKSFIK